MVLSCGVLVMAPPGCLLLGHASGSRHWDIPKGLGEADETPRQTALREAAEEAGLRLTAEALLELGRYAYRPAKSLHLFATLVEPVDAASFVCTSLFRDAQGRLRPELDRFRWLPFDQVASACATSLAKVLTQRLDLAEVYARLVARSAAGAGSTVPNGSDPSVP